MSYIGKEPQYADFLSKFFNGDGTAMTVTLDASPPNEAALLVFIDGVRQDTSAYTVSGYSLTFTGVVPSGTNNVQVVHLGIAQDTQVPVDDSVSTAKIQDDAVTSAKLANSLNITSGNSLTIDSGATITNNGTASGFGGVNTPAFSACMNTNTTLSAANTYYKASFDTELLDTDGAFDTSTYRFTVPSGKAGKYFFTASIIVYNSASGWIEDRIKIYKNGSAVNRVSQYSYKYTSAVTASVILDLVAGDYIEVYGSTSTASGTNSILGGSADQGSFAGFRMVE